MHDTTLFIAPLKTFYSFFLAPCVLGPQVDVSFFLNIKFVSKLPVLMVAVDF